MVTGVITRQVGSRIYWYGVPRIPRKMIRAERIFYFAVTSPSFLSIPPISGLDIKFFHTKPVR
jgi:hypothetical protein